MVKSIFWDTKNFTEQWSSTLAASSEILGCVRDVGLINSLHPSVVELHAFVCPEVGLLECNEVCKGVIYASN
jgi:hypothetical protein